MPMNPDAHLEDPVRPITRRLGDLLLHLSALLTSPPRTRDERGDVPGWVLITVMTAGLVTLLYSVASSRLQALLDQALSGVGLG